MIQKKVIVTGGGGFIGSHLVDRLISLDITVLVIDNFVSGNESNLKKSKNLNVIKGDISDYYFINKVFKSFNPDFVIHAAASYKNPDNWLEDVNVNIIGTINVINVCKIYCVSKLIYLQTSLSYGLDPGSIPLTLNSPLFSGGYIGGSSYAISKTAAELYIELSGVNFVSFRLANVYGPRNISGPLPAFYKKLKHSVSIYITNTRRDFIFISDLVDCVVQSLDDIGKEKYYHIGSGKDYSIHDLFRTLVSAMNYEGDEYSNVKFIEKGQDDVETILLNIDSTKKDFNWFPKIELSEGVSKCVEWYDSHDIDETFTHLKLSV
jgi:UDP-glucose 4-epimerase